MSAPRDTFDERVRAYRDETAAPGDGRATRARVLAAAEERRRRVGPARPTLLAVAAALVIVLTGAGALTAIGRWRAAPAPRASAPPAVVGTHAGLAPALVAPAASTEPEPRPVEAPAPASPRPRDGARDVAGDEQRAYGRAHALHFGGGDARAALAAWNAYLAQYPRGAFLPEARFNRALALVRLGRADDAAEALRPFADGAFGAYRRAEAAALLESLRR